MLRKNHGDYAERFMALYPANEQNLFQTVQELSEDEMMVLQNRLAEQRMASGDKATYVYFFSHIMPGPDSAEYGAFHTSDVPYFLNNSSDVRAAYWTQNDYLVGNVASQYLLNFARNGDLNGQDLPTWLPFNGAYEYMEVSEQSRFHKLDVEKAALWKEYLNSK